MNRLEGDQTSLTEFPKQGCIVVFALTALLRKMKSARVYETLDAIAGIDNIFGWFSEI